MDMTSDQTRVIDEMYRKITEKIYPGYSQPGPFVCESDLKVIWSDEGYIRRMLDYSDDDYVHFVKYHLLKTLSTLVLVNVPDPKQALDLLCPDIPRQGLISRFPFPKQALGCLPIQQRDSFFEKQYLFCPIVIENRPKAGIIYKDAMYRLPFIDTISPTVGSGGYGNVRINKIAPHYYRDLDTVPKVDNPDAQVIAYKVFSSHDDFQLEKDNLDFLKESLSAHKHIVLHLAAIVRGSDFYIFLPYTKLGSLEVFLCGGIDESPGTDLEKITYDFDTYFSPDSLQPVHMLKQMLNLCGALDFLHNRLQIGQSQMYCAHMDLRPQNVLVFDSDSEPVGKWRISDFGISSFKKSYNTKEQMYPSIRDLAEKQTTDATKRNLEGAHRSPENHSSHKEPFSGRKSDMWSFACIFSEVLTFALGGKGLLKKFRNRRIGGGVDHSDAFFTIGDKLTANSLTKEYIVNGSVVGWLHWLTEQFVEERPWIEESVELILATLKITPGERLRAHGFHAKLKRLLRNHFQQSGDIIPRLQTESREIQASGPTRAHDSSGSNQIPDMSAVSIQSLDGSFALGLGLEDSKPPASFGLGRRIGVHLRDLVDATIINIPRDLASTSMNVYPSSQGLFAFRHLHTVTLFPGKTDILDVPKSYVYNLTFNATGDVLFLWARSTKRSDRIYIWDVSGETPELRAERVLSLERTSADASILPSTSQTMCVLNLPGKGVCIVEAQPDSPKARIEDAEKPFQRPPIAYAATDEHLVYVDRDYNVWHMPVLRNGSASLALEASERILGRCHKFAGTVKLVALTIDDMEILITICTRGGEVETCRFGVLKEGGFDGV
ncbi:MAG: hypothetical protein Q9181_004016 [Wetmoreana brouardii]